MWLDLSGWLIAAIKNKKKNFTLPETNIAPEKGYSYWNPPSSHLQGYVSFREGNAQKSTYFPY